MIIPRVSIGKLMVLVGLIAVNLTAIRLLCSAEPSLLTGFIPAGLVLQFGAFRLIRSRTRARVFWAGFVTAGLLAGSSLAWAMIFHSSVNIGLNGVTGRSVRIIVPGSPMADRMWSVWRGYFDVSTSRLEQLPLTADAFERDDALTAFLIATMVFLPQIVIALTGGLLAVLLVWIPAVRIRQQAQREECAERKLHAGRGGEPGGASR